MRRRTKRHSDDFLCGDVLRIKAVELPYLAFEAISLETPGVFKMDTRKVTLTEVGDEYAKAMEVAKKMRREPIQKPRGLRRLTGGLF